MLKKIIIGILISVVIIVVSAFIYLNNVFIPQKLKPLVIETLEKSLQKKVNIEKSEYFPMKGFSFNGISVVNLDETPFLSVKEVILKLKAIPKVQKGRVAINAKLIIDAVDFQQDKISVKGDSLVVDIAIDAKSQDDLKLAGGVVINNIVISGLSPLADINELKGKIGFTQDSFNSQDLSAKIGQEKIVLTFKGVFDQAHIKLDQLTAVYGKTNLSCSGELSNFINPQIEAVANGAIAFESIPKMLTGITLPGLSGVCDFSATAGGSLVDLRALKVQVNANIPEGAVDKIKYSQLDTVILLAQGKVYANPLNCVFYEGKVAASAEADIINKTLPITCSADITNLNIDPLIADVLGYDVGSAKVDAHIGISGPAADINALAGSGWFKMTEGKVKVPSQFGGFVKIFQLDQLSAMLIKEASATFTIANATIDTQDLKIVSDLAEFMAKGHATFAQYIDFEIEIALDEGLKDGLAGQINTFIRKVRVWGTPPDIKKKVLLDESVKAAIKEAGKEFLKGLLEGDNQGKITEQQNTPDLKDQLKQGLKGLLSR
ncbi:MAG: AsmA family protein [Candidatus Omnitrophota bacterium]